MKIGCENGGLGGQGGQDLPEVEASANKDDIDGVSLATLEIIPS